MVSRRVNVVVRHPLLARLFRSWRGVLDSSVTVGGRRPRLGKPERLLAPNLGLYQIVRVPRPARSALAPKARRPDF
jgi:hypothetical protein